MPGSSFCIGGGEGERHPEPARVKDPVNSCLTLSPRICCGATLHSSLSIVILSVAKNPVTFIPKLLIDFIQNLAYIYTE